MIDCEVLYLDILIFFRNLISCNLSRGYGELVLLKDELLDLVKSSMGFSDDGCLCFFNNLFVDHHFTKVYVCRLSSLSCALGTFLLSSWGRLNFLLRLLVRHALDLTEKLYKSLKLDNLVNAILNIESHME